MKSIYNKKNPNSYIYNSKNDDVYLNQELKDRFYDRLKLNIREYNVQKLNDALTRYITPEFVKVKNINIVQGTKGFEITANLVDNQGRTWNFDTKAIGAGGYNIQSWHYRYLINLSSPEVPREVVRQKISEREKQQKEEKQQQRKTDRLDKQKDKAIKKLISVFGEIKNRIKDWDSWERHSLNVQVSEHRRLQQEFDQTLSDVNRLREFLQKYNLKRVELTKKIKDNEINFNSLNEINDIINKNPHYFYSYNEAKRFHNQNLI